MAQQLLLPDPQPLVERLGRDFFRHLPERPGVYLMRDASDVILYIGKAKNLRKRLGSYRVANPDRMPRRHLRLLHTVARIELQECPDESTASARESELLRAVRPRFNRAGTWPAPPRFLAWRYVEQQLQLAVAETPAATWRLHGPLQGTVFALRAVLARLLWLAVHPRLGFSGLPIGWSHGKLDPEIAIHCGPMIEPVAANLERLLTGQTAEFCEWIRAQLPADLHPFEKAAVEVDLEMITDAIGLSAPRTDSAGVTRAPMPETQRTDATLMNSGTIKASGSYPTIIASVIMLISALHCPPASADGCPAASFAAPRAFDVGLNPVSLAVSDFNNDGKPDLAVVNNNGVSVLLSKGDGTFQYAANYNTGPTPSSVAVGDFNGDGKLDLAVANAWLVPGPSLGTVSLLLGNGDGTFRPALNYGGVTNPTSVAVGDFNGDGTLDLAVVNKGLVSVLSGNGDGTFHTATNYSAGSYPVFVSVGDFNKDGKPDLAVVNFGSDNISVFLGKDDGTFQPAVNYAVGALPQSIAIGDFNKDGRLDLTVANSGSTNLSVLLGNGDGTFQAAANFSAGAQPVSVAVGDFDGDGKPDLAAANNESGTVSVLLGNGDGTFQTLASHFAGARSSYLAVGDFNGDARLDVVVLNNGFGTASVLLGNGDGTLETMTNNYDAGTNPFYLAVGDLNGDGKPDLVVANAGSTTASTNISVLVGVGDGSFQTALNYSLTNPVAVALGDFNGDGNPDLAVVNNSVISVLLGRGDGTFQAPRNYAAGLESASVAAGDFNGDGKLDLAVANEGVYSGGLINGTVSMLLGNGDGTFQPSVNYDAGIYPRSVAVGDFNEDGKLDLAVANEGSANLSVLLGTGEGTFQAAVNYAAPANAVFIAVGDFNGDAKPDLTVATYLGVSVLLGNGDGTFRSAISYGAGSSPYSVAVGDFNGDGRLDLAVANRGSGNVSILLGNGDGTFQAAADYGALGYAYSVAVGDFNGDDRPDLAVANYGFDNVSVLLNTCVSAGIHLAISSSNSTVTISWPIPSTEFAFESTTDLGSTNWQPAAAAVRTNNSRLEATVPLNQAARYFRLRKP